MRIHPNPPRIPRWALYGGTCVLTMTVTAWVQLSDKRDVVTLSQPASVTAPVLAAAVSQVPQAQFNTVIAPSVMPPAQAPQPTVLPHLHSGTTAASPVVGVNGFAQPAPEAPPADPDSERAGN